MIWPTRQKQKQEITDGLQGFSYNIRMLPGIANLVALDTLAVQFVASLRREDYYKLVQRKAVAPRRADPNDAGFDAERAVAYHMQNGDVEEAAWLIFLMTHLARPADTGWLRLRHIYGKLGQGIWTWQTVAADPQSFVDWLAANWTCIGGKFGNHRKYESLDPNSNRPFGKVLATYLEWIGAAGHKVFFAEEVRKAGNEPGIIFDHLYSSMTVLSFGRLAKFDYLALIGRYGIAPIHAGQAYFKGATGPARGARLLFDGSADSSTGPEALQDLVDELDGVLGVGMHVMEDALCNWQKSPTNFVHFKG
ncbi:hypothetical protein SAMN02983003_0700 [Devosia enhydra]|uniref:Alpha-glutamyl/putrescinyl thymine pyrophosphorylase clade 3 domain-containing protein n=1 Tax=Devosia enhydra TaxID=665118 RepID=A0A1K2HU15_9HYPH|nr:hypothetical protein [Devosia enhydra]SFZ81803.1 hypothetical protein SAMN02983003_0700 [Devosia enhydra]